MEGLGIDWTAESLQLLSDVVLSAMAAVRSGRARPNSDKFIAVVLKLV